MSYQEKREKRGEERRKADFLVLKYLEEKEEKVDLEEFEKEMKYIIDELEENKGVETPIHYIPSSHPSGINSKSLLRSIERCQSGSNLERYGEGKFKITEVGRGYLEDVEWLEKHGVHKEFREAASEAINRYID